MTDGDKESGNDSQIAGTSLGKPQQLQQLLSSPDDFGRAVSRIAVAQICVSIGFHSANHSALDALADVAILYVRDLGKISMFHANLAGRTSCNEFDVIHGLEDLECSHGFSGAPDPHHCPASSGVVQEIVQFVNRLKEVPFARTLPSFPVARVPKTACSFAQAGEAPGKHIPNWLPKFPDPHTYIHTPAWNERATDAKAGKIEQARQRRKAERSLLSLQIRLSNIDRALSLPILNDDEKGKPVVNANPFLAVPFPYGEQQVSEVVATGELITTKRSSVLETFAPAIEAAKCGSLELTESDKWVLLRNRPTINFKIGIEKKSIAASLVSSALSSKKDLWSLRADEKDDKKRRAEMILKEAMEKPHDLAQL